MGLFDKLESKLEQGVNGAFARAFKSEVQPVEIASGIRRAMDDRAASVAKGKRPIVPNLFTVELSPTDYERLAAWGEELDDELVASAQEHIDEQRYQAGGPLTIVLSEAEALETGVFRLRPATAKAADAFAHQRANPRPKFSDEQRDRPGTGDDDERGHGHDPRGHAAGAGTYADASDTEGAASHSGSNLAAAAGAGSTSAARPLSARIKEYLLGTGPQPAAGPGEADRNSIDHRDHSMRGNDARDLDADGDAGTYGDASEYRTADDYADAYDREDASARGRFHDAAHPDAHDDHTDDARWLPEDARDEYGSYPAHDAGTPHRRDGERRHHAWDDDSWDGGADPTGFAANPDHPGDDATAHHRPEPQRPRAMSPRERPWLKIDGQRYPLLGAITVLGRDDDADIVIDDPGVSRRHTEIRVTHDGPHLVMSARDLGSTNGTFVNGEAIDAVHVHDGDRLTLGRTPMTIHLGDSA